MTASGKVIREALKRLPELRELASTGVPILENGDAGLSFLDLERAVKALSPRRRQAVELALIKGCSTAEASAEMSCTRATISQLVVAACDEIGAGLLGDLGGCAR